MWNNTGNTNYQKTVCYLINHVNTHCYEIASEDTDNK